SRSRRIRSSSSACPRARRRRKTPRTTRRTRRRTTSPTKTRRTATRTRRTDAAVVEGTSCCPRATAVWLSVTHQEAGATAFDCGGPGLLMCPSDSALTDAEPFDSSASLPAREVLSDLEGHFERLVVVESRVDEGLVATPQTFVIDLRGPAHDLRDVIAGEFDVESAGDRSCILVGIEEPFALGHDIFEATGLVPGVRGDRIAVHRVADPGHVRKSVADSRQESRQRLTDLSGTHAGDEGQAAGLGIRIELLGQGQSVV